MTSEAQAASGNAGDDDWVRVSVPATSANLGPGYDCFGLSLDRRDVLYARRSPVGVTRIEVFGEGQNTVPRDESNLVHRSAMRALAALDEQPFALDLLCDNVIPHGGGQGSSAAAIVAGLAVGRALASDGAMMSSADLLDIASGIEGHPDNAAPAVLGGFTLSWTDETGRTTVVRPPIHPELSVVVFSADRGASTEMARTLLPDTVPHRDAARNTRAAALLMYAISHEPDLLAEATQDWLHQRYRASAMRPTADLVAELREEGYAATVSGAGPSVLVLLGPDARTRFDPRDWQRDGFSVDDLGVDTFGVIVNPGVVLDPRWQHS